MEVFGVKNIDGILADENGLITLKGIYKEILDTFEESNSVNYTISLLRLKDTTLFISENPIILNVPVNNSVAIPIGGKKVFTVQGNGYVTVQGAGITFTGNIFTFSKGSTVTLTKTAINSWTIQVAITKLSQLENDVVNQIIIATTVSITSATKDTVTNTFSQNGKNVVIANGVNTINYTINDTMLASYLKTGTGAITFLQGSGRTLIVNGIAQTSGTFNGLAGSTATLSSVGTTDYLLISNLY